MKRLAMLSIAAVLASGPLSAQTLLHDNFNAENGGASYLNYSSFANWTVVGQVDLVASGNFGISCSGGIGSCVDLDGSSGPGYIVSQYFAFNAGDRMKFSVNVSGNQRSLGTYDDVSLNMMFGAPVTVGSYLGTGGFASSGTLLGTTGSVSVFADPLIGSAAFSIWTFEFQALTAGSVQYTLGTDSGDAIGPIVDDVQIDRTTLAPEPSTWAMLAFGMGAVGVVSRRRVRKA